MSGSRNEDGTACDITESLSLQNGYYLIPVDSDDACFSADILLSPRFVQADPRVKADIGKVALTYGPWVYCLEEADNGKDLPLLSADPDSSFRFRKSRISGREYLEIEARGFIREKVQQKDLYEAYRVPGKKAVTLRFIPYHMWANREEGRMQVFVRVEE